MAERAAIYIRVSSDPQRDNYSPGTQLKACREYATANGYSLVGDRWVDPVTAYDVLSGNGAIAAYVDDYTSRELSRPALDTAIEYARQTGYDVLIIHALDRLARDPYIRQTLERDLASVGVKVRYVLGDYSDTPEGEVRKDLEATFGKWETAKRLERVNRGKIGKAERGLFVAGRPPYGYTTDKSEPGGLAICGEQAAIVRRVFDLYTRQSVSIRGIADLLTTEGVRPWRGGNHWGKSTVQKILSNEAYIGHIHYNKHARNGKKLVPRDRAEWVAIEIAPLVDEATFALAQLQLSDNQARVRKQPKRAYLLVGLVICEECGLAYHTQARRAGKQRRVTEALSYRHRVSAGHCLNRTISARLLEPAVWNAVTGLLLDPASLLRGYEHSIKQQQSAVLRKRTQLDVLGRAADKLRQRRENLLQAYTDPEIGLTKTQYLGEKQRLEAELQSVDNQRQTIEAELAQVPGPLDREALETYTTEIREYLEGGIEPTFEEKRRILEMLHVKIVISADGSTRIEGWFGDPVLVVVGSSATASIHYVLPLRPLPGRV